MLVLSCVWFFVTPWAVAHQAPLSMGVLLGGILEWVATPFFKGSSRPRDRTWVFCIAGRFFTIWATREAISYTQPLCVSAPVNPNLLPSSATTVLFNFSPASPSQWTKAGPTIDGSQLLPLWLSTSTFQTLAASESPGGLVKTLGPTPRVSDSQVLGGD